MKQRYLISPKAAIGTAVVAAITVIAAIALRRAEVVAAEEVCRVEDAPAPAPDAAAPVVPATPSAPPKIEAVKASAQPAKLGVEIDLEVALTLPAQLQAKEFVTAKASCKLDGEWYSGSGSLLLRRTPAGTSVVPARIRIGSQHAFTTTPTECQLGIEFSSYLQRPGKREWLAKLCWDGKTVTDKPCAPATATDGVAVSAVRVQTSAQRYRTRRLGAPVDLEVSLDAEIKRPLTDRTLEIAADCTLPDGSTQHATNRVATYDVHAGRPFTSRALLFRGAQQMLDVPTSCTLAIELADRQQLVREPVSAWCWRDGAVASGACG
jgi:hypothetical protein